LSRGLLDETKYKAKHYLLKKPMLDILSLLQCLIWSVEETTLKQMSVVVTALLGMSGRVTMKGISKSFRRGCIYVQEVLKYLPQIADPILGAIHPTSSSDATL
jgi:hypothetical protein